MIRFLLPLLLLVAAWPAFGLGLLTHTGNLLTYSEQFDNAIWVRTLINAWGATDTGAAGAGSFANTTRTTDPNGENFADFMQEDNTSGVHFISQSFGSVTAGQYSFSVYAKAAGRTWFRPAMVMGSDGLRCNFQLSGSGTVGTAVNQGTASGATGTITSLGSGWYLCKVTGLMPNAGTIGVFITLASADNTTSFAGDNTSGIYVFGGSLRGAAWLNTYLKTTDTGKNGKYFTDPNGKAVMLSGGHVWGSVQTTANEPADYTKANWVNLCTATNWGFQRLWCFDELLMSHGTVLPLPFQRTGPGNAADGGLKIDLSLYDQTYFDALSNHVSLLNTRGIYCSVMFFQGVRVNGSVGAFTTNIWNTANNVNGVVATRGEVYTMNATHYALATNYVKKVIDTVNGFPNVLYEIGNEMPRQSTNFQNNLIQFVRDYEATKPVQHVVGMTSYDFQSWNTDAVNLNTNVIEVSLADWTSYEGIPFDDSWKTNPPVHLGPQVSILDTDHIWGANGTPTWVWRAFTRGHNPINQDTPGSGYFDFAPDNDLRQQLGHIKRYSDKVDMSTMVASTTMASTGFIMTNTLLQQLAYQPDANNFTTKMKAGRYWYEKWRTDTSAGGILSAGYVYQPADGNFTWLSTGTAYFLFTEPVRIAGGIDFDGSDDVVNCGSGATLDDITQTTWAAWFYMRSGYIGNCRIAAKESAAGDGTTALFLSDSSGPRIYWARKFSGTFGMWYSPLITSNTWFHVAITYNDASTANDPLIYINGASQSVTEFITPTGTRNSDAALNFTIGASGNGSQPFDGMIQDVRVYNRILTVGEILTIYRGHGRRFPITSGLKGYWPLDDGPDATSADGDTARDLSGNGNNGTGDNGAGNTGLTWRSGSLLPN